MFSFAYSYFTNTSIGNQISNFKHRYKTYYIFNRFMQNIKAPSFLNEMKGLRITFI
jgi:hypothetical protein